MNASWTGVSGFDKRALKRRHLIYYLRVTDVGTGELVGHVVDLNVGGVLLVCTHPDEIGRVRQVDIHPPSAEGASTAPLRTTVEVRWAQPDVNPDHMLVGCRFPEADEALANEIEALIELIGFADSDAVPGKG